MFEVNYMSRKINLEYKLKNKKVPKKSNHFLSIGLAMAIISSAVGVQFTINKSENEPQIVSNRPIKSKLGKPKIHIHFTAHTLQETICGLEKPLADKRPNYLFLESASLPLGVLDNLSGTTTSYRNFIHPIPEYVPIQNALLDLLDRYGESSKFLIFPAEYYTADETDYITSTYNAFVKGTDLVNLFVNRDDIHNTLKSEISRSLVYAQHLRFRNDRIFLAITQKLARIDIETPSSVLIVVGDGHRNLVRVFADAGFTVDSSHQLGLLPLVVALESKLRGWNPNIDEETAAATELTRNLAAGYLETQGYGEYEQTNAVVNRIIPDISPTLFATICSETKTQNILTVLRAIGYVLPTTQAEYNQKLSEFGLDCK